MGCDPRPATVHAMLEDDRAGLGIDRAAEEADRAAGRRITCPAWCCGRRRDDMVSALVPFLRM